MKKKILSVLIALTLFVGINAAPAQNFPIPAYAAQNEASTPAAPKSSQESGSWEILYGFYITLSCKTKDAAIYYKINDGKYRKYVGRIYISENTTLKTYAKRGGEKSRVRTYTYEMKPVFFIETSGNSEKSEKVTVNIRSDCRNVTYYYTTDGSKPTKKSKVYTKPLKLDKNKSFRVLAVKEGWTSNRQAMTFSLTSSGKSKLENYREKYYYNTLSKNEKKAYERIYEAVREQKTSVDLRGLGIDTDRTHTLYRYVYFENPQFFYISYNLSDWECTYSYTEEKFYVDRLILAFNRSPAEIGASREKFGKITEKVVREAKALPSDYERIRYIHDWIALNTTYTPYSEGNPYVYETDGCPVYGKAVCNGYSRIFCYLAQSLGYDAIYVVGDTTESVHAWNGVKLGKNWYLIDVTWDDLDDRDSVRYQYFLKSEREIADDHTLSDRFVHPSFQKSFA